MDITWGEGHVVVKPTEAAVTQYNYYHAAGDVVILIIDDYVLLQFVDVLLARQVYLLHTISHDSPSEVVRAFVRIRIQWLIDDARKAGCYGIHVHDGAAAGISHDFIRQMLHTEFGFEFLPHVGAHWLNLDPRSTFAKLFDEFTETYSSADTEPDNGDA